MCGGFGGGGGGFGGGGSGMGGGFTGFDSNFGNSAGLSFGGSGSDVLAPMDSPTKTYDMTDEERKQFLGSKPGYDEKKLQALANKKGKQSLYIS
tara:strand:+ start:609 stop:890 length:282 start_codon:yes stop_codon:yes gene_type:complete